MKHNHSASEPEQIWLTLQQASAQLGVHPTTLRTWADQGQVRSFRTPGGHRRFLHTDIQQLLTSHRLPAAPTLSANQAMQRVLGEARITMAQHPPQSALWYRQFTRDELARDRKRQQGAHLFALAMQYVLKPDARSSLLEEGRRLGQAYASDALQGAMPLAEMVRGFHYYRQMLTQALQEGQSRLPADADDLRIAHALNCFLDEVLVAVIAAYEAGWETVNKAPA